jgi:hypothetical protein
MYREKYHLFICVNYNNSKISWCTLINQIGEPINSASLIALNEGTVIDCIFYINNNKLKL